MPTKVTSLVVGGLAGLLVGAAAAGGGGAVERGAGVIRITDQDVRVVRVDIGARGTSPGDMEIVHARLYNRRLTQKPIGRSELLCTFLDGKRSRSCRGTYFLPRGKLVVGGSLQYRQFYDMAVIGGTGIYDDARGTLTVTRTTRKPVRAQLIFRLVG